MVRAAENKKVGATFKTSCQTNHIWSSNTERMVIAYN